MYNIKLNDYVPAPSPAHSDRIVAAHYYAAWKYGAAGLHEGFNDLAKDYPERTPQDQGFTGYNTSWVTPDFFEVCAERLKKSDCKKDLSAAVLNLIKHSKKEISFRKNRFDIAFLGMLLIDN